jgi:ketosteroid isomerase-like protein
MSEHPNARLIRDFHERQNQFYAGGDQGPAAEMLAADVAWHVPGHSPIAGHYRSRDEVLRYFARRRDLAHATFRIAVRDVLADEGLAVILAGSQVQRRGRTREWQTASVFRLVEGKIAECWVLPYDQYAFDDIWA